MWIINYILNIVIPAVSAYLASDDTLFIWLTNNGFWPSNINIDFVQRLFLILNIIFTTFVLNLKLFYLLHRQEQNRKEVSGLFNMIKQFAQSSFISITDNKNFSFDLRIFVPEISVCRWIKAFLTRKQPEKVFVIKNIEPFAKKDITEHLRFRVEPNKQGLVGEAYETGAIVYDDKLSLTNSTDYALAQSQLSRTSNLRWSICVPICNNNNEVIAVMAFDSDSSDLNIGGNKNEIKSLTNTLAIMMRDSVPDLFKLKWRLM